ncbi:MAG: hypothetical protein HY934_09615 [Candidatus Firestonebacteria bacterium]|nr:hypothetical protein [Candidatus Firestonebacteria bacterium]
MIKKIKDKLFSRQDKKDSLLNDPQIVRWVIGIVNFIILLFVLLPNLTSHQNNLRIGDIVLWDIRATRNFPVIDEDLTEKRKKIEIDSVNPIFDINLNVVDKTQIKITKFFEKIKKFHSENPGLFSLKDNTGKKVFDRKYENIINNELEEIKNEFLVTLNKEVYLVLLEYVYKNDEYETFLNIEKNTGLIVKEAMLKGILLNKDTFFQQGFKNKIEIHYPDRGKAVIIDISEVFDEKEVNQAIKNDGNQLFPDQRVANVVYELTSLFIKPNLTYNINKTRTKKKEISDSFKPEYIIINKGELIARQGERISEAQYNKYQALIEHEKQITFGIVFSRILMVLILLVISYFYLSRQYPRIFYNNSKLILITIIFNIAIIIQKIE